MTARRGFTLLEVLLAITLTALVLAAVAAAIDFHLRLLGSGRADVEQTQLARAVLQRIAADLRGAVACRPDDAGVAAPTPSDSTEGSKPDQADSADKEPDEAGGSVVIGSTAGLYGTAHCLQVDVSRLPHLDSLDGMPSRDRPGDIKTVAYFLAVEDEDGESGGLMRGQWDRAVVAWANENNRMADFQHAARPLAPEVATIEFRYFDGVELNDRWDMDERGGLPMAVEILLRLRGSEPNAPNPVVYRLVVHLRNAWPISGKEFSS